MSVCYSLPTSQPPEGSCTACCWWCPHEAVGPWWLESSLRAQSERQTDRQDRRSHQLSEHKSSGVLLNNAICQKRKARGSWRRQGHDNNSLDSEETWEKQRLLTDKILLVLSQTLLYYRNSIQSWSWSCFHVMFDSFHRPYFTQMCRACRELVLLFNNWG